MSAPFKIGDLVTNGHLLPSKVIGVHGEWVWISARSPRGAFDGDPLTIHASDLMTMKDAGKLEGVVND